MQISREKDIDTLVYAIKKVRRAVLRNTVDSELRNTQAECYGLPYRMKLRSFTNNYNTIRRHYICEVTSLM
jgi:hypothetical protein